MVLLKLNFPNKFHENPKPLIKALKTLLKPDMDRIGIYINELKPNFNSSRDLTKLNQVINVMS